MSRFRRDWRAGFVAVSLLFGCLHVPEDADAPAGHVEAPKTAQQVLDRYIEAIGGEAKVRAILAQTTEARLNFQPEKGCPPEDETCLTEAQAGTFVMHQTGDGKLYRRMIVEDLIEERGYDGKDSWQLMSNGLVRLEDPLEAAVTADDAVFHWYFPSKDMRLKLLPERAESIDGVPRVLDGVVFEHSAGNAPARTRWFERSSGLLLEETLEGGEGEQKTKQVVRFRDYKPVDGVLVAHRVEVRSILGERERTVEFVTRKITHAPVKPETFALPQRPAPEKVADARVKELEETRRAAEESADAANMVAYARAAWANAHFAEAERAAQATLKLDASEPEAMFIAARTKLLQGRLKDAERDLARAAKVGVRPEVIALQRAWIHGQRFEFAKMAAALEQAGLPAAATRYRAIVGQPFALRMAPDRCLTRVELERIAPAIVFPIQVGTKLASVMLDTGAADMIVSRDLLDEIEVPVQPRPDLAERGMEAGNAQIPRVQIGGATLTQVPVDVIDKRALAQMTGADGAGIDGVMGVRVLQNFQVTLDIATRTLELVARSAACKRELGQHRNASSIPFFMHETHYIYVQASMNDTEGLYLLNTAMRGAAVTANSDAYAFAGVLPPILRPGEAAITSVETLKLGELELHEVPAAYGYFEDNESRDGFRIDGMLGPALFANRSVTFDFDDRRLYLGSLAK